jgi:hypothetical protein
MPLPFFLKLNHANNASILSQFMYTASFSVKKAYSMAGFEPKSSFPRADAMTTVTPMATVIINVETDMFL